MNAQGEPGLSGGDHATGNICTRQPWDASEKTAMRYPPEMDLLGCTVPALWAWEDVPNFLLKRRYQFITGEGSDFTCEQWAGSRLVAAVLPDPTHRLAKEEAPDCESPRAAPRPASASAPFSWMGLLRGQWLEVVPSSTFPHRSGVQSGLSRDCGAHLSSSVGRDPWPPHPCLWQRPQTEPAPRKHSVS